jgi:hypothetical protein
VNERKEMKSEVGNGRNKQGRKEKETQERK